MELMEKLADGQTDGGVSGGISNPRSAGVLLNHCTAETERGREMKRDRGEQGGREWGILWEREGLEQLRCRNET